MNQEAVVEQPDIRGVEAWVAWLADVDIPVLERTVCDLQDLRRDRHRLDARHVAHVVARDPLMSVKLLRHFHERRRHSAFEDIVLIERALIMLGMEAFFGEVAAKPVAEDMLRNRSEACACLQAGVRRAHRASRYAADWGAMLHDLHLDEVRTAASLHDFTELLLWCLAPARMALMRDAQRRDPKLRSKAAQADEFGCTFAELQLSLAQQWGLPPLLIDLMDDACSRQLRVRNVALAVRLARHSDSDWNNPALPDDYRDIGYLLRMTPQQAMALAGARPTRTANAPEEPDKAADADDAEDSDKAADADDAADSGKG